MFQLVVLVETALGAVGFFAALYATLIESLNFMGGSPKSFILIGVLFVRTVAVFILS